MRFVPTSESADRCKSVPAGSRAWAGGRKRVGGGGGWQGGIDAVGGEETSFTFLSIWGCH